MPRTRVPAVGAEGWFTEDGDGPALLGTRCTTCGTVWSYTDARYQPPPPYVPVTDPYEPFAIAAVELADEAIVVLGQVADGYGLDALKVGSEVELVVEPLFSDDDHEYVVWKWRPCA